MCLWLKYCLLMLVNYYKVRKKFEVFFNSIRQLKQFFCYDLQSPRKQFLAQMNPFLPRPPCPLKGQ